MGTIPVTMPAQRPASCDFPPLPAAVFRARLETIHARLADLEGCCPPGCRYGLADALEAVEDTMAVVGWQPPPLSEHDLAFLAALGCPAPG